MLRYGFMPTVLPTRVTSHCCTLIDHIFYYSKTFKETFLSGNLFADISDHFANFIILDSETRKENRNQRPNVRIFSEKNKKILKRAQEIDWEINLGNKSANDAMNCFYKKFEMAYYKMSFPLVKLSRNRAIDKPWITTGVKKEYKRKQRSTKQARSSKSISKLLVSGKEISGDKQIANALNDYSQMLVTIWQAIYLHA